MGTESEREEIEIVVRMKPSELGVLERAVETLRDSVSSVVSAETREALDYVARVLAQIRAHASVVERHKVDPASSLIEIPWPLVSLASAEIPTGRTSTPPPAVQAFPVSHEVRVNDLWETRRRTRVYVSELRVDGYAACRVLPDSVMGEGYPLLVRITSLPLVYKLVQRDYRPKIVRVAIRFHGVVYSLPAPKRHHDVIRHIIERTGAAQVDNDEQGFLDDTGRFLTRQQALEVARRAGQIKDERQIRAGCLFSEDVW